MNELEERIRSFAVDLLARRGALVEWEADQEQGLAILPQGLARAWGAQEAAVLSVVPPQDGRAGTAICVGLASEFLEHAEQLLEDEPRTTHLRLRDAYLKKSGVDEAISRQFDWLNARVRLLDTSPGRCEYHHWYLLASVESEERWEDLLHVAVNRRSEAVISLGDPLGNTELTPAGSETPADTGSLKAALRAAAAMGQSRAEGLIHRLELRLERDRKRLRDYYRALLVEAKNSRNRSKPDPQQDEDRKRAVNLELRRKLQELEQRYAVRARLTPVAMVVVDMPVLVARCEVTRRQAQALHNIYWNPLTRGLEPMHCAACGENSYAVAFTDGDVRPICADCYAHKREPA